VADSLDEAKAAFRAAGEAHRVAEPMVGARATRGRVRTCRMEHNPHFEALDALHRKQAEIREQIRVSKDTVERPRNCSGGSTTLLAKSPLKP
jgi:hypothetical protein